MRISYTNDYTLLHWRDRIWKIGPDGKLIPKRDEQGNIIVNPLSGQAEYETIEDGTRVTARRLNHMDDGIYRAHEFIIELAGLMRRMQVQMELDGRVPGNSGTFADTLDGSTNKITLDTTLTDIKENVAAGITVLPVASVAGFVPFSQVTIFDDESYEDVFITSVGTETITVQALTNSYKKGAKVARSIVSMDLLNKEMGFGDWQIYHVDVVEVV